VHPGILAASFFDSLTSEEGHRILYSGCPSLVLTSSKVQTF